MLKNIELAKSVLAENSMVLYGIFSILKQTGCFPPSEFLNEFFLGGSDPCDQDGRMKDWPAFSLNDEEYLVVKEWWCSLHSNTAEKNLGAASWDDWVQTVLDLPPKV